VSSLLSLTLVQMSHIHRAISHSQDSEMAMTELNQKTKFQKTDFSLIFFSNHFDSQKVLAAADRIYGSNYVAVSTAGEICPEGTFSEKSMVATNFTSPAFQIETVLLQNLDRLSSNDMEQLSAKAHTSKLRSDLKSKSLLRTFCILLIDGVSGAEEVVTEAVGNVLGDIPLVGGSAADGLDFGETSIIFGGNLYSNAAIVLFVTTSLPFEVFKTQHFDVSKKRLVITESIPESRIVKEINGIPAAEAYANELGLKVADLDARVFSQHPLVLKIADGCYVRSIQQVYPDQSLKFYCAIETGLVLSVSERNDIVETTANELKRIEAVLGELDSSILFECILRRIEVLVLPEKKKNELFTIYKRMKCIGFHTYGEQFGLVHINQTLTGVAFGKI